MIGEYKNGNTLVSIFEDGTVIKYTADDEFNWEFPNSMDVKITDSCDMGCRYCHEGSTPSGKHGNIHLPFFDSLHPYTEIALGGGNILAHPDIEELLIFLKSKDVIANITVNQVHYLKEYDKISNWIDRGLVKGIGISLTDYRTIDELVYHASAYPHSVIHVINGIFNDREYDKIKGHGLKLLILGYKDLRRGHTNLLNDSESIRNNKKWLTAHLKYMVEDFEAIALDNLAVEQLPVHEIVGDNLWPFFFQGNDGRESGTMYIDCVKEEFALSSTSLERFPLMDSVDDMYKIIKERS